MNNLFDDHRLVLPPNNIIHHNRIVEILLNANISINQDLLENLPSWTDVVSMYGNRPKIIGIETCQEFRRTVPLNQSLIGPAGMFNTGTNLLAELLNINCVLKRFNSTFQTMPGTLWQVPWGKHNPASWRTHNVAKAGGRGIRQTDVLPVVIVKDPYSWMGSMCRHSYAAHWNHTVVNCPNLVSTTSQKVNKVTVHFKEFPNSTVQYESLVGLWNDWYGEYYYKALKQYPILIIRFEDLLFHTHHVVRDICNCVGGTIKDKHIQMNINSAKGISGPHEGSNGLVSSILRYGSPTKRIEGMTRIDLIYAQSRLERVLMRTFGYIYP